MYTVLKPIIALLTMVFNGLHQFIVSIGVTNSGVSYVLAVLLVTVIVRLILLPLNIKQMKSQTKMQELQPKMQQLQNKYKNDPQKQQMEIMKLYKEFGVSPFSGCLPLLIQMPILFSLYYVFMGINIGGASFLWLADLQQPDPYYILPILSTVTTFLSTYMMSKSTPSQNTGGMNMNSMNIVMSLMSGFIALRIGSLLVLYWIMGNLIQIIQNYFLIVLPAKKKKHEEARKNN
ncbi:membrane protein insertase YidC [Clostridium fallax]|uniref:Protein translocase subunit yidC n=1 Tax=Clostridium fallax TaxID=1533 RepID=A0A1M4X324_9CLOT|nr:membrane protein insertase YidC [Clostridium fallax]SHE87850.1 protein translocase subunit yidC [Clostridium fallax]SQB22529.1 inner membrane protein translocase component YidC [Clostridium fallax]